MLRQPLAGVRVVEVVRANAATVTGIAVAFAGRLVAGLGGQVTRVLPPGGDPLRASPPFLPDGASALQRFLTAGKDTADALPPTPGCLIGDDAELAARWSGGNSVLVESAPHQPGDAHSELTVLAASGLLDIFGAPGAAPLPLPGHQTAYAAGLAAFNACIGAHYAHATGQPYSSSRVAVLDVALWLNWKHYLAAYLDLANVGIDRLEEWRTYPCRDGYVAFVFQDKDLGRIATLTGDARFTEPRFATHLARRENLAAFSRLVADWVAVQTRDEIVVRARRIGLPIGPVLRIDELLDDAQLRSREFIDLVRGSATYGQPRLPAIWVAPAAA